ncbi:MAG: hypothetical protein H3C57_07070 [Gammaproteobacteria bacterium]|nr:hypothetical protein [Gammaproteobacteria bacterium]
MTEKKIPVLTDFVGIAREAATADTPAIVVTADDLAELQSRIATESYVLMERLLHESLREMEANLFADVIGRLRSELPNLVEDLLQEHLGPGAGHR